MDIVLLLLGNQTLLWRLLDSGFQSLDLISIIPIPFQSKSFIDNILTINSSATLLKNRKDSGRFLLKLLLISPDVVNTETDKTKLMSMISSGFKVRLDEEFYVWILNEDGSVEIWETYRIKDKSIEQKLAPFRLRKFRSQEDWSFVKYYRFMPKVKRRSDFKDIQLTAVIEKGTNRMALSRPEFRNEDPKLEFLTSLAADILLDLKTLLNFRVKVVIEDWWEVLNATRRVDVDDAKYADFSASLVTNSLDRARMATLLIPVMNAKYKAFFKIPNLNSVRNAHIYPFQESLWIGIWLTWGLIFTIILTISKTITNSKLSEVKKGTDFHFEVLWSVVPLICMKSHNFLPSSISLRVVGLTGGLFGMLIYMSYSAVILSSLTVPILPIKRFQDLLAFKYKFTLYERSQVIRTVVNRLIKEHNLSQKPINVDAAHEISHLLEGEAMSYISYTNAFYAEAFHQNYSHDFLCKTIGHVAVSAYDRPPVSSLLLPTGSPFTQFFNYRILTIKERGLHSRYVQQFELKGSVLCESVRKGSKESITFSDTILPFLILTTGISLAFFIQIFEIFYQFIKKKRRGNKKTHG